MFPSLGRLLGRCRGEMVHCMHGMTKPQYEVYARKFTASRTTRATGPAWPGSPAAATTVLTTKHKRRLLPVRHRHDRLAGQELRPQTRPGRPLRAGLPGEGLKVGLLLQPA